MSLLADRLGYVRLTEPVRFRAPWEQAASLRLRDGDTTVLADYDQHARINGGDPGADAGRRRGRLRRPCSRQRAPTSADDRRPQPSPRVVPPRPRRPDPPRHRRPRPGRNHRRRRNLRQAHAEARDARLVARAPSPKPAPPAARATTRRRHGSRHSPRATETLHGTLPTARGHARRDHGRPGRLGTHHPPATPASRRGRRRASPPPPRPALARPPLRRTPTPRPSPRRRPSPACLGRRAARQRQSITDLAARHRHFAARLAERHKMIPSAEDSQPCGAWAGSPRLGRTSRDAILQPPRPQIQPSEQIMGTPFRPRPEHGARRLASVTTASRTCIAAAVPSFPVAARAIT